MCVTGEWIGNGGDARAPKEGDLSYHCHTFLCSVNAFLGDKIGKWGENLIQWPSDFPPY